MARPRRSPPPPPPLADGEIARVVDRLYHNRHTAYQTLCVRLGRLQLDLPLGRFHAWYRGRGTLYRHCPNMPVGDVVLDWVLDVMDAHTLAGVVLCDALDMFGGMLNIACKDDHRERFPTTRDKKELTQRFFPFCVEFEVPVGWDLVVRDQTLPAGFRGVALVPWCHLSQSFYQGEHGYGKLLGVGRGEEVESAIGFDIPCELFPKWRVEGESLVSDGPPVDYGIGMTIPYAFVRRAFYRPWNQDERLEFYDRPEPDKILRIAGESVARIRQKADTPTPEDTR